MDALVVAVDLVDQTSSGVAREGQNPYATAPNFARA